VHHMGLKQSCIKTCDIPLFAVLSIKLDSLCCLHLIWAHSFPKGLLGFHADNNLLV